MQGFDNHTKSKQLLRRSQCRLAVYIFTGLIRHYLRSLGLIQNYVCRRCQFESKKVTLDHILCTCLALPRTKLMAKFHRLGGDLQMGHKETVGIRKGISSVRLKRHTTLDKRTLVVDPTVVYASLGAILFNLILINMI